ncbi:MAG: pyridoxamine 5'-phosphate oxidase family protein [Flavobacteriaceae bacterium]|nr:pyridoxamine 5'-phosphate oxidase family protein [Flavobacteriaceae bacterium]
MKKIILCLLACWLLSCSSAEKKKEEIRSFSEAETAVLKEAKSLMQSAYYCSLITLDKDGLAQARVVEPFPMQEDFVIWIATNPKSRKVVQIKNNPNATLHYFDKNKLGYVSLYGKAYLVNDAATKQEIWKAGWEKFYPNRETDYLLIRFEVDYLDMISALNGFAGDKTTWKPHQLVLRSHAYESQN